MSGRAHELAARREALLERSEWLRQDLAEEGRAITRSLGLIDRGIAFIRTAKLPSALALAATGLLVVRPRAAWWVASRGVVLWPILRRLLPRIRRLISSATAGQTPSEHGPAPGA